MPDDAQTQHAEVDNDAFLHHPVDEVGRMGTLQVTDKANLPADARGNGGTLDTRADGTLRRDRSTGTTFSRSLARMTQAELRHWRTDANAVAEFKGILARLAASDRPSMQRAAGRMRLDLMRVWGELVGRGIELAELERPTQTQDAIGPSTRARVQETLAILHQVRIEGDPTMPPEFEERTP